MIKSVVIIDKSNGNLDPALKIALGYLSNEVESEQALRLLAQRIASTQEPITGVLLNQVKRVYIDQTLSHDLLATQDEVYDKEDSEQGEDVVKTNISCIKGNSFVGERKTLIPSVSVFAGSVKARDLEFVFEYIPGDDA